LIDARSVLGQGSIEVAGGVASALLAQHGIYVRDGADKRGLVNGERFIRVAARSRTENHRIVDGLRSRPVPVSRSIAHAAAAFGSPERVRHGPALCIP
jgi:hypothetical protein